MWSTLASAMLESVLEEESVFGQCDSVDHVGPFGCLPTPYRNEGFGGTNASKATCGSGAEKDPQSQKFARTDQRISEQFRGVTGHSPVKTRVLRQSTTESSPERSAKSLSQSFSVVPFLSGNLW